MPRRERFHRRDPNGFGTLHARDTTLSPALGTSIWENFPKLAAAAEPGLASIVDLNFLGITPTSDAIPGWTTTKATSGAVTLDAVKGLKIDSGAVTAGQGINLQLTSSPFTIAAGKPVWWEGSFRFEGLTSLKAQFLAGLATIGTTLITGGAVGTEDKAAFDGVTTAGTILSDCTLATTSGTGTGFTVANNTTYILGIYATTTAVQFWVNRLKVATLVANIPTGALAPAIVVQANATVQPIVYVRRLKVAGLN